MIELLPRLRRFAYALTGSMDHADDLVQDTCERALARMDQWTPGTRLDSWMYRIAQNLWVDNRRAKKSRGDAIDIDTLHDLAGSDGRKVTEGRLTLMRVGEEMNRLSAGSARVDRLGLRRRPDLQGSRRDPGAANRYGHEPAWHVRVRRSQRRSEKLLN